MGNICFVIGSILLAARTQLGGEPERDEYLGAVLFWAVVGGVIGAVINGRMGHSAFVGFIGGAVLGPVLVWLFLLGKKKGVRKCPFCAEQIKREAKVCKFCQREVPPPASRAASADAGT